MPRDPPGEGQGTDKPHGPKCYSLVKQISLRIHKPCTVAQDGILGCSYTPEKTVLTDMNIPG